MVPGNPVISNPVTVNAVVPPMVPVVIKAVNPAPAAKSDVIGVRPFGFGVRPFGFGFNQFGFGFNPFFDVDFGFVD